MIFILAFTKVLCSVASNLPIDQFHHGNRLWFIVSVYPCSIPIPQRKVLIETFAQIVSTN